MAGMGDALGEYTECLLSQKSFYSPNMLHVQALSGLLRKVTHKGEQSTAYTHVIAFLRIHVFQ